MQKVLNSGYNTANDILAYMPMWPTGTVMSESANWRLALQLAIDYLEYSYNKDTPGNTFPHFLQEDLNCTDDVGLLIAKRFIFRHSQG